MKTASVRELRNNYAKVLRWVENGEEVEVTRRGAVIAKVVPAATAVRELDWSDSAALGEMRWSKTLTAKQSSEILAESQGG